MQGGGSKSKKLKGTISKLKKSDLYIINNTENVNNDYNTKLILCSV